MVWSATSLRTTLIIEPLLSVELVLQVSVFNRVLGNHSITHYLLGSIHFNVGNRLAFLLAFQGLQVFLFFPQSTQHETYIYCAFSRFTRNLGVISQERRVLSVLTIHFIFAVLLITTKVSGFNNNIWTKDFQM